MQYLAVGCRAAIGLVFLLAASGKVIGPGAFREFRRSVADMQAVPVGLVSSAARATVAAEALTVVLVAIPLRWTGIVGCALGLVLTVLFTNAIVRTIRRGTATACRCFGRTSTPLGPQHLIRNGVLLVLTVLGLLASVPASSVTVGGVLVAVVAGVFVGLILANVDELTQLLVPV